MTVASGNPSFVLRGIEDVVFENRPVPEVRNDQVLIKIEKTGICGSDVHYLQHGKIGNFVVEQPMCLGHESSGTIVKLGGRVKSSHGLKEGMRVALEPGVPCRTCAACKGGFYELCQHMSFAATPPTIYGTLARYYVLPADLCHPISDSMSFEDGAMIEPLSVGVHSVATLGKCQLNQVVVVFGCGPVGLLCMAVARAIGARRVIAVDINNERVQFAKNYAATAVYIPIPKEQGEDSDAYAARASEALRHELGIPPLGRGSIDLTIDATGAPSCVAMSLHLLRPAGTFVAVGMGSNMSLPVSLFQIISKQLRVVGSFRYGSGDYELAISLVERGLIDLKPLVTQRYAFLDARAAFEATKGGKSSDGKPVIKCMIDGPK